MMLKQHGRISGYKSYGKIQELRCGEALFVLGKKRQGGMSVLGYAAREKHRHRDDPAGVQCDEDKVRPGFRYEPYGRSEKYHQSRVVAYPAVDVQLPEPEFHEKQDAGSPAEDDREVPLHNMVPQMFVHEMVRSEDQKYEHNDAECSEEILHSFFAEEVDSSPGLSGNRCVVMVKYSRYEGCNEYYHSCEHDRPLPCKAF